MCKKGVELKPCPFCGSQPEILDDSHRVTIMCSNSEGEDPCRVLPTVVGDRLSTAASRWNTRKNSKPFKQTMQGRMKDWPRDAKGRWISKEENYDFKA